VDTRYLARDDSGVALAQIAQDGQKQILAVLGANLRLSARHLPQPAIRSARVLLVQLEIPFPLVEAAIRMVHQAGLKVVLDPAPARPLADELLGQVDLIKPNASEAESLTGIRVHDRASAKQAAHQLLERGVGAAIVQAGEQGNLLVWRGGESWNPRLPVKTVDATGAGDAMAAALAICLVEGRSLAEAGPFANAAAALATTALGAQAALPSRQDVEDLLKKT
jgi:ribokinase